jgi:hypothetical protein
MAGYNANFGSQVDAAFQAKGLPIGSGAALLGIENPSGDPNATSITGIKGPLQQTSGFMAQWNPGGSTLNPNDNIAAASNFFAAQQAAGYTPAEAYVIYQQGPGGAHALFNSDPSAPISSLPQNIQTNLINNGVNPNGTVGDAINHVEGQYASGAGLAKGAGLDTSGVPTSNRTPPKGNNAIEGTNSGGTSFGGAGCAAAGLSPSGLMAMAAAVAGGGMGMNGVLDAVTKTVGASPITGLMSSVMSGGGNIVNAALNAAGGGASNFISGAISNFAGGAGGLISNALNSISGGAFQALSQIGSNILPSLTGVLPGGLNGLVNNALVGGLTGGFNGMLNGVVGNVTQGVVGNLLGPLNGVLKDSPFPNAIQQFGAAGGLNGMIQTVAQNMVGGGSGNINNFVNNIGMASAYSSIANNIVGGTAEAVAQQFGNGVNGLGAAIRNNNDLISFGLTSLTRNINGAANDMLGCGNMATTSLLRLQQPSHVASQILDAGLGGETGLTTKLVTAGLPIAGIDNPLHDAPVKAILDSINDSNAVGAVSAHFNIKKPLQHLGQLTDFAHMCPNLAQDSPSQNFSDLGQQLISLGMTRGKTFSDYATAFSKVDAGLNLQHLSQNSRPITDTAANSLMQTFGYGGGTLGEITTADFIGTAGGYVHNDTLPYILDANTVIAARPEGQELTRRIGVLQSLISGTYYVPGSPADNRSGSPAISDAIIVPDLGSFTTLDAAVFSAISYIESQLTVIKNITDPNIQAIIKAAETAHAASCAQILKENHFIQTYNMDLFEHASNTPVTAYVFAAGLPSAGNDNGYGKIGHYIERVATDNIYGDSIKAALRMGRNAAALEPLGVQTDRFQLPHSQYYRNPTSFYLDAYTAKLPITPTQLVDQVIPKTPQELYIDMRNQTLINNGYNPDEMLPAQADEKYYDLRWISTPPAVLENIGLTLLQEAVNRNIIVVGDKCYVIGLDRSQNLFATIDQKGLLLTNSDNFVGTMLSILNKMLYGDIGTTKYETPFFTDQMVYGMLEMFGQITPNNVDALKQTLLGGIALGSFLDKLRAFFGAILNNTNTGMDRNIYNAWGGSGPDGDYTNGKRR